jgi:hypothetical protein
MTDAAVLNSPKPHVPHLVDLARLPKALQPLTEIPNWVGWRYERNPKTGVWTKPPFMALHPDRNASYTNPATWSSYPDAVAAVKAGKIDGIGFCLTPDSPFACIDVDRCRDDRAHSLAEWGQNFLEQTVLAGTYCEVTPSLRGTRIWGTTERIGRLHQHIKLGGDGFDPDARIELYARTQMYLTITGIKISAVDALGNIDRILDWAPRWAQRHPRPKSNGVTIGSVAIPAQAGAVSAMSAEQIDRLIAEGAPDGERSELFQGCVWHLAHYKDSVAEIAAVFTTHRNGLAARYIDEGRLLYMVAFSLAKMPDLDQQLRAEAERILAKPPARTRSQVQVPDRDPIPELLGIANGAGTAPGAGTTAETEPPPDLDPALKGCDWVPVTEPGRLRVGDWVQREAGNSGLSFRWPMRIRAIEDVDSEIWVFVEGVLSGIAAADIRVPVARAPPSGAGNGADQGAGADAVTDPGTDPEGWPEDEPGADDELEDEPESGSGPDPAAIEALREQLRAVGYSDAEISQLPVPKQIINPAPKRLNLQSVAEMLRKGAPPPRQKLLGDTFAKEFLSGLFAPGAVGKTVLRMAQALALACGRVDDKGRGISGEYMYKRSRVLFLCLEDSPEEVWRRLYALCKHYQIDPQELDGWIWVDTPEDKLATTDRRGNRIEGDLGKMIRKAVKECNLDLVILDPLVDSHEVDENAAADMNFVCKQLTKMAIELTIGVDTPHHTHKGALVPGDPDSGRGSTAIPSKGRLIHTLATMSKEEAKMFGIDEAERRFYVRMDPGKMNIAPPREAIWFHLVGVKLGNPTMDYPDGDYVQAIEPWTPPDTLMGLTPEDLGAIAGEIHAGITGTDGKTNWYSDHGSASPERAAWTVVQQNHPELAKEACREIVKDLVKKGVLYRADLRDSVGRPVKGLQRKTGTVIPFSSPASPGE